MNPILQDCYEAFRAGALTIIFPMSRLGEFLEVSTYSNTRFTTMDECERFRQACLNDEAKAFGIPVLFA